MKQYTKQLNVRITQKQYNAIKEKPSITIRELIDHYIKSKKYKK